MEIRFNNKKILEMSKTKEKVIQNEILSEIFEKDMERRLCWVLTHKYKNCFNKLKEEWTPKLKERGVEFFPTDDDKFAELVFSQPDYEDRSTKEEKRIQEEKTKRRNGS